MKRVKVMSKVPLKASLVDCELCIEEMRQKGKSNNTARRACERKGDC